MSAANFLKTRKGLALLYGLFTLLVAAIPLVVENEYILRVMIMIWIYSILTLSLNFIIGFSCTLSFGHHAFYGIGAYTTGLLMTEQGMSFIPAIILSVIVTFIFGLIVGVPVTRVRGDYLVLLTLAFGEIFRLVMQGWISFTGGHMGIVGIPAPGLFDYRITTNFQFYYLGMILVALTFFSLEVLTKSKVGRAMIAIREDELAASSSGVNTGAYKLLNFALGCMFAGLAGGFLAVYMTAIAPSNFTLGEGVLMIVMVIVGGLGSLPGSILGAAAMLFATEAFRDVYTYRLLIIGLIMILVLIWHPQGIMGIGAWKRSTKPKGE
ncbi:MAG: branched-chain amino acid ABC transporter permease [Deltaproteobacteria bacterium]|nr:branched-chain amino acid ABC transporter permease [Deltaproteobacteria bacterium]